MPDNRTVSVEISKNRNISVSVVGSSRNINLQMQTGHSDYPVYSGGYVFTSLVGESQTLQTNGKVMSDNVTINEIPYTSVSNAQGGRTVNIG